MKTILHNVLVAKILENLPVSAPERCDHVQKITVAQLVSKGKAMLPVCCPVVIHFLLVYITACRLSAFPDNASRMLFSLLFYFPHSQIVD